MQKKYMRICAMLMVIVSVISLAGCMSKPSASTAQSSAKVEAPEDIWAPYPETVVITTMGEENSGTEFQNGDDYGNNPWYRAYKERFNIDLQNKWISNDYGTKLNLLMIIPPHGCKVYRCNLVKVND